VSEDDARTYAAELHDKETLTTTPFAERGGTSVVTDTAGNVYIAGSQLYFRNRVGKQFGGADRQTPFIGARSSRYAIQTAVSGQ
jgi:hypothetical protein